MHMKVKPPGYGWLRKYAIALAIAVVLLLFFVTVLPMVQFICAMVAGPYVPEFVGGTHEGWRVRYERRRLARLLAQGKLDVLPHVDEAMRYGKRERIARSRDAAVFSRVVSEAMRQYEALCTDWPDLPGSGMSGDTLTEHVAATEARLREGADHHVTVVVNHTETFAGKPVYSAFICVDDRIWLFLGACRSAELLRFYGLEASGVDEWSVEVAAVVKWFREL